MLKKINCVVFALLLVTHCFGLIDAKRYSTGGRKTSSSSSSGRVTRPSYSNSGTGSSHSHDPVKLSYPSQHSQPSSGGQNSPPIGWNVPKQQGPPPAYSASNPVGGGRTNINEAPPAYRPNNAAPPSYGAAVGSNVHTPLTATNTHGVQSSYPGATYHSPGSLPAGATYYPSGGHMPHGSYPAGGGYSPGGHYQGGGYYPGGAPGGGVPPGATFLPAGSSLPAGATYYSQPPSSSSGLGFGSGLAAGAIGGALLGHVLTPTHTRVIEQAPASSSGGGEDRIIIINNGQPGTVNATEVGSGTTVINTGNTQSPNPAPADASAPAVPLAPMAPIAPMQGDNATMPNGAEAPVNPAQQPPPPQEGGIICVPMRVNETDPNDSTKMVEVEKIACYPAPPPPPQQQQQAEPTGVNAGDAQAPLAPMNTPLLPENSVMVKSAATALHSIAENMLIMTMASTILMYHVI